MEVLEKDFILPVNPWGAFLKDHVKIKREDTR